MSAFRGKADIRLLKVHGEGNIKRGPVPPAERGVFEPPTLDPFS
jgi:hypothetical protein